MSGEQLSSLLADFCWVETEGHCFGNIVSCVLRGVEDVPLRPSQCPDIQRKFATVPQCRIFVLLQDAVRGDHREVGRLLMEHGAKVMDRDATLVDLSESHMSLNISLLGELEPDWEIDPADITFMSQLGAHTANMGNGGLYGVNAHLASGEIRQLAIAVYAT